MPLTDESLMPFGQYKGKQMADVPASYLMYLYDSKIKPGDVRDYIVDNLEVLKEQVKRQKARPAFGEL
jgi:uncharacterized protein (DUF3820 family)